MIVRFFMFKAMIKIFKYNTMTFYDITENSLTICYSYRYKQTSEMISMLQTIICLNNDCKLFETRKLKDMIAEWQTHNLLYYIGLFRSHTRSVNFEANQSKFMKILYKIFGKFYSFIY